jgi:hypothetical protein
LYDIGAMYTLHTSPTPNGWKASVLLEEVQLPYEVRAIDLGAKAQRKPWFLERRPESLKMSWPRFKGTWTDGRRGECRYKR